MALQQQTRATLNGSSTKQSQQKHFKMGLKSLHAPWSLIIVHTDLCDCKQELH